MDIRPTIYIRLDPVYKSDWHELPIRITQNLKIFELLKQCVDKIIKDKIPLCLDDHGNNRKWIVLMRKEGIFQQIDPDSDIVDVEFDNNETMIIDDIHLVNSLKWSPPESLGEYNV